jgi:site-specific DNA-methyltransferase (adenine-specific)
VGEQVLWASKAGRSRYTFNYHLINSRDQDAQLSSVWHIPSVPKREKLHGYHPTQKPPASRPSRHPGIEQRG